MSYAAEEPTSAATEGAAVLRQAGLCVRAAELSAVREEQREVDFICSTDTVDSYGERVAQSWKLDRFKRNPVALWSHSSRDLPVGQWMNVRVEEGALRGTFKCATAKANPQAEYVWQSILERTLRAVSVGFKPGKVLWEDHDGVDVCVLSENDLFEISVVPLPANPDAVIEEMKARARSVYLASKTLIVARDATTKIKGHEPTMKEAKVADTIKTDDHAEMYTKLAATDAARAKAEAGIAERDATIARLTAEQATASAKAIAAVAASNDRANGLAARLRETELLPLVGKKVLPAELDGLRALGAHYDSQGEAGALAWKCHLDALAARSDIPELSSKSVLIKDPTSGGLRTNGAGDDGDDLLAQINATN